MIPGVDVVPMDIDKQMQYIQHGGRKRNWPHSGGNALYDK